MCRAKAPRAEAAAAGDGARTPAAALDLCSRVVDKSDGRGYGFKFVFTRFEFVSASTDAGRLWIQQIFSNRFKKLIPKSTHPQICKH